MHISTRLFTLLSLIVISFAIATPIYAYTRTDTTHGSKWATCDPSTQAWDDFWITVNPTLFSNSNEYVKAIALDTDDTGMASKFTGRLYMQDQSTALSSTTSPVLFTNGGDPSWYKLEFATATAARPSGEGQRIFIDRTVNPPNGSFTYATTSTTSAKAVYQTINQCTGKVPTIIFYIDEYTPPVIPPTPLVYDRIASDTISIHLPFDGEYGKPFGGGSVTFDSGFCSWGSNPAAFDVLGEVFAYCQTNNEANYNSATQRITASISGLTGTTTGSGTYQWVWSEGTFSAGVTYSLDITLSGGEIDVPINPDYSYTHVIEVSPDNETVATGTVALSSTIHVLADDFESGMVNRITWYRQTNSQLAVVGASQPSFGLDSGVVNFPITSSGLTTFSTTTTLTNIGVYTYKSEIFYNETLLDTIVDWFTFNDAQDQLLKLFTKFTVSTTTGIDDLYANPDYVITGGAYGNFIENLDIDSCSFLSGNFSVLDCLKLLIIPPQSTLLAVWNDLMDNTLRIFPLGYITRLLEIVSMHGATMPPALTYTFGTSGPEELEGKTISIQIFDHFDTLATIEADDGSGKNVWDIVNPYFTFIVALAVLGVIIRDLLELGLPDFNGHKEEDYPRSGVVPVSQLPDQDYPHATYGQTQTIPIRDNRRRK